MPGYRTPKQFPGTQHLPELAQQLLLRMFPPDQLPAMAGGLGPTRTALPFPNKSGGPIPEGIGLSELFRTKVTPVPQYPGTIQKINDAFGGYRDTIKDLLLGRAK